MKRFFIAFSFLSVFVPLAGVANEDFPFVDVPANTYYYEPVKSALADHIVSYNKYFYPGRQMTRAEFVTSLVNTLGLDKVTTGIPPESAATQMGCATEAALPSFSDVPKDHWAYFFVETAKQCWLISGTRNADGTPTGKFEPNKPLTRAEAAVIITKAFVNKEIISSRNFPDMQSVPWAKQAIQKAATLGFFTGYRDGTFGPANPILRAEGITMLMRVREKLKKGELAPSFSRYADACDAVRGATFISIKPTDVDENGELTLKPTISFAETSSKKEFVWEVGSYSEEGKYTCTGYKMKGDSDPNKYEGFYDSSKDLLTWDGEVYERANGSSSKTKTVKTFTKADFVLADANNQFALKLYPALIKNEEGIDEGKNVFFSPYSISTAFGMVYEGAREKTADEMESVFEFQKEAAARRSSIAALYNRLNNPAAKYKLSTANALWVEKTFKLLKEYTDAVEKYYGGKATNVDFMNAAAEVTKTINKWVEDKTNGKIKNLFPEGSLDESTRLALTNAIYFKGTWAKQFKKEETKDEEFRVNKEKKVTVPMMRLPDGETAFKYAETDKLQMLELPYEGDDLSMLILLPKNDDLKSLETSLTLENLDKWKTDMWQQPVDIYIPKFILKTDYTLNEKLKKLGMQEAFDPAAADLSGISGLKNLFISIVVHKAFVEVNEEGTEAAAATGIGNYETSIPPPTPVFRADRPFIFVIQEQESGNILFIGRVIDPTS